MDINTQLNLFNKLKNENRINDANMVIKNLFNKFPGDEVIFKEFQNFNLIFAGLNIEMDIRQSFLDQALTANLFFSEHTDLTEELIDLINDYEDKIRKINNSFIERQQKEEEKYIKDINDSNKKFINELVDIRTKLSTADSREKLNIILKRIYDIEKALSSDYFTPSQQELYEGLTKDYGEIIGNKLKDMEKKELIEYNKKAVDDFEYVYRTFKKDEGRYKDSLVDLELLVKNRLFSYDSSKLLNESLIYFNQVYSYIFSKLDDDGKFKITTLSLRGK